MPSTSNHSAPEPQATGWRDYFKIHPAAKLFPPMPEEQLKGLGEDIAANGFLNRITLFYDGERPSDAVTSKLAWWRAKTHLALISVLDGCNRLDAAAQFAGYDWSEEGGQHFVVKFREEPDRPAFDPYAFAISANIHRRHLNTEQRLALVADVIKAQPEKSDRQIAAETQVSPTTAGKVRKKLEDAGQVSSVDTRKGKDGKAQPAHKAAKPPPVPASPAVPPPEPTLAPAPALDTSMPRGDPINLQPEPPPPWTPRAPELFEAVLKMLSVHSEAAQAAQVKTRAAFVRDVLPILNITVDDLAVPPVAEAAD